MKRNLYILLLCSLCSMFFCSCNNKTDGQAPGYGVIDLEDAFDNNSEYVNLSKYASSVEYIPLETNEESVLGRYPKFLVNNDYLYVDYLNSKRVVIFDISDGKYARVLKRYGRAYGEYLSCMNFDISAEGNDIIVLDVNKKFIRYDSNQNCIYESLKMDIGIGSMIKVNPADDNSFFYNEVHTEYLPDSFDPVMREYSTLIDSTGVVSRTLIGMRKGTSAEGRATFFQHDNHLKVLNAMHDTIFNLSSQNERSLAYVVSLGKYEYFKVLPTYDLILRRWVFENDHFLFFKGALPMEKLPQIFSKNYKEDLFISSAILYDKKEKKTYALKKLPDYDYIGFVNDIDNGAPFCPLYMYGNKMYQFIDAAEFISLARQCDVPRMKEVASQLTEESNPVMVVATLK